MKARLIAAKKRESGFSLIETIVAVTILAVMLLSLVSVFVYGFNALSRTRQTALATQIAQEEMETIRALTFDQIAALGVTFTHAKLSSLPGGQGVLAVEAGPGVDIKKVSVGVRWIFRGLQRKKDIVTYMTRKGINRS